MITNPPTNELFFPKLQAARDSDALLDAACVKIKKKLEKYALSSGIKPDKLCLFDLCDPEGKLHPKLQLYIDSTPKLEKQTEVRYEKYKEEISANVQRAIDAVVTHITGVKRKGFTDSAEGVMPALLRHEHPVLIELYGLLPRQVIPSVGRAGFERGTKITENGCLIYLSCVEALKQCSASSLHEFLAEYRHVMAKSIRVVCLLLPEKIHSVEDFLWHLCKKVGIKGKQKRKRLPVEEWPSPLREEMQVYRAVAKGKLMDGLEEKLSDANVNIKIRHKIRPSALQSAEGVVEFLRSRYYHGRERLSIKDILSTTVTEVVNADGKKRTVYYNEVLTPHRESEKARSSKFKRRGWDSMTFKHTLTYLLSVAAYNGIFEYHEIIRQAFKIKIDNERIEQRKAEKKSVIKRQCLDQWVEDNWAEYERILVQKLFMRDRSKRTHTKSDLNMRFVLYYCRITTMIVMGYRQRQLRDCLYGVNLVVTQDSVEFTYAAEKTKKGKPLHFQADLENCSKTHGRLINTLELFYRYGFQYTQANLKPRQTGDDQRDQEVGLRGQFFVHLTTRGKFVSFDPERSVDFTMSFKSDSRRFLKHPDLQHEAALMIHPHYIRGASMDTQIEDNGMSMEAASRYFGVSEQVIQSKYKDKNAIQDASRDVRLLNAQMEDLEERKKRNRSESSMGGATRASKEEVQELRRQLQESHERENLKITQVAKLEERLDKMHTAQDKHHEEIMKALSKESKGQAPRKRRTKGY